LARALQFQVRMKAHLAVLAAPFLLGCMNHGAGHGGHGDLGPAPPLIRPTPRSGLATPAGVKDANPDPAVVEVSLTAATAEHAYLEGRPAPVWAYNGTIPGPTIEANRGDLVVVHFRNDLPEPTTIHWHGVRVPNAMDGAGRLLQPVPPGGTFDYRFVVPDAGTFWYHPHVRSDVQVEKGLYGAIVVRDPADPDLGVAVERLLLLDDVLIDPASGLPDERVDMRAMMMGREGNLLLVNGQPTNGALAGAPGERVRLRIVNVATARFFKLGLERGSLTQIGSDGGLLPYPRPLQSVLLVPGERVDVVLDFAGTAALKSLTYERARGAGGGEDIDLVRFTMSDAPAVTPPPLPASLSSVEVLPAPASRQTIRLGERMAHHGWQFTVNDEVFPNVAPIDAASGSRAIWRIENESEMDHPFHVHGFFFQRPGAAEWKDTVNIPSLSAVDLVVDFAARDGADGDWMYHCHILEHAEGGMMGEVRIR
jgi:FtsP/CotA-like multicopper oxidase with cupredoxin domain